MRSRRSILALVSLAVVTTSAFAAVTAGSLAWYAYTRTITVSYVGTSVSKSALLNVGIVDDYNYISDNTISTYDLERVPIDGHSVVFTHSSNGLDHHVIQDYLFDAGHAVDKLFPVTTQSRGLNVDTLSLYKSPEYGDTELTVTADNSDYVKIPFAFRIENRDSSAFAAAQVWLTDTSVQASGENIDQAVRVFVKNKSTQRGFLMKPADRRLVTGSTKVGGLLDLDGDGTYDYNKILSDGKYKEYYYGQHTGNDISWSNDAYGYDQEHCDYDNVNGIDVDPEVVDKSVYKSTFYAKHNQQANTVNLNGVNAALAEYESLGTVIPSVDNNGDFYENTTTGIGKAITTISGTAGIGYADFSIFIEGWDHSVVDKSAGYTFNLGLKFEINRI